MSRKLSAALASVLLACVASHSPAEAQSSAPSGQAPSSPAIPAGWRAQGLEPLSYIEMQPGSLRAFKMSMKRVGETWFLFVATGARGKGGFEVYDVTNPAKPVRVSAVEVPGSAGQVTVGGNLAIIAQQRPYAEHSVQEQPFAGIAAERRALATIFDVSDPRNPKKLSEWIAPGWGTHRNTYPGGRYAYLSAWIEGFKGQATMIVLDLKEPANPVAVGGWWQPGQKDGEPDRPAPNGFHGPVNIDAAGTMLTTAYTPSLVNLDITDPAKPKLIGSLAFSPLPEVGAQAMHTALPLRNGMMHFNTEPSKPGCGAESLTFSGIIDNRNPAKPMLVSYYPQPSPPAGSGLASFCDAKGRFGPHNVNGESHSPDLKGAAEDERVYMTFFTAGLRVYDVRDPFAPKETGWFLPAAGPGGAARGLEDVIVDKRDVVYVSNGGGRGVWILRRTGDKAAATETGAKTGQ
jgi:hypothetical protein